MIPTSVREAALLYVSHGLCPVAVYGIDENGHCLCALGHKCHSPGKHPIGKDWQKRCAVDADVVLEQFKNDDSNVGLKVGEFVVIDIDSAEGELLYRGWRPPETLRARSGSGKGLHDWFVGQPHQAGITNRRVAPGIDVKTGNGQVIVEPSRHASGGSYKWENWGAEIAPLPDHLYEKLIEKRVSRPPPVSVVVVEEPGRLVERCRAYVDKMPPAISGQRGHEVAFAVARKIGMDFALKGPDGWNILCQYNKRCSPPFSEKELRHKWEDALNARVENPIEDRPFLSTGTESPEPATNVLELPLWQRELKWKVSQKSNRRTLIPNAHNAALILKNHPTFAGKIRRNLLTGDTEACGLEFTECMGGEKSGSWKDSDTYRLQATIFAMDKPFNNVEFPERVLDAAVEIAADAFAYHPIRDYLDGLSWDGSERIGGWLGKYFGAEDGEFNRVVGARFLISAVARIMRPGCKVDTVLVLDGLQGATKSSAFAALFGATWTTDTPIDVGNKDAFQSIQGSWLVELAELTSMGRSSSEALKAFFSSAVDIYRPSYGKRVIRQPRQCVFVGSTNRTAYLKDETGNRRYWPVHCPNIDVGALKRDRDQLWAEAVVRFKAGDRWWLTMEEDHLLAEPVHESRMIRDPWEADILALFRPDRMTLSIADALRGLGVDRGQWNASHEQRVGRIMKMIGARKTRLRTGNLRQWAYRLDLRTLSGPETPNENHN